MATPHLPKRRIGEAQTNTRYEWHWLGTGLIPGQAQTHPRSKLGKRGIAKGSSLLQKPGSPPHPRPAATQPDPLPMCLVPDGRHDMTDDGTMAPPQWSCGLSPAACDVQQLLDAEGLMRPTDPNRGIEGRAKGGSLLQEPWSPPHPRPAETQPDPPPMCLVPAVRHGA